MKLLKIENVQIITEECSQIYVYIIIILVMFV